jgi:CelD/BcsL family acetyltransferase involved in cellulose biosynthesis
MAFAFLGRGRLAGFAAGHTGAYKAALHRAPSEIEALWRGLYAHGAATVFQSYQWAEAWYRAGALKGAEPAIVSVHAADGTPALIAPLAIFKENGRRVLAFADLGVTDYNAPLIGPASPVTAPEAARLWAAIRAVLPPADLQRFEKMPKSVGGRANPFALLGGGADGSLTAHACPVSLPFEDARAKLMTPKFAKELDARLRKFAARGAMVFGEVTDRSEKARVFDALVAQKKARAAKKGWTDNILDDPVWERFYRDIVVDGEADGIAHLLALTLDGRPWAIIAGFRKGDHFCDCLASFDDSAHKSLSLGLLVQDLAMRWAAERGVTVYDLTIGAETYKGDFSPVEQRLAENVQAYSMSAAGEALTSRAKAFMRARPWIAGPARRMLSLVRAK